MNIWASFFACKL